jgi:hypothetical protein
MRGRNGTFHRYYYCRNHDPLRAGGEHRRCPERNIRAEAGLYSLLPLAKTKKLGSIAALQ